LQGSVPEVRDEQSAGWLDERIWYVSRSGQMTGPISTIELAVAAKNRLLSAEDEIWRIGLPRWFAAGEIGGLLPPVSNMAKSPGHR
jgi:hypothetical protein